MVGIQRVMSTNVITVEPSSTVQAAAETMASHHMGALVVVKQGRLHAMFTERDVLERVVAKGLDPTKTQVGDVATQNPISVRPETSVLECYQLIKTHRFRHLPVVDADQVPQGILSVRDFFECLAVSQTDEVTIDELCERLGRMSGLMSQVEALR